MKNISRILILSLTFVVCCNSARFFDASADGIVNYGVDGSDRINPTANPTIHAHISPEIAVRVFGNIGHPVADFVVRKLISGKFPVEKMN